MENTAVFHNSENPSGETGVVYSWRIFYGVRTIPPKGTAVYSILCCCGGQDMPYIYAESSKSHRLISSTEEHFFLGLVLERCFQTMILSDTTEIFQVFDTFSSSSGRLLLEGRARPRPSPFCAHSFQH